MFFVVSLFQSFKVNKCIFHLNIDEITSFYIIHCKHVFNMHQSRTHEIFVKTMLLNIIIINFTGFFLFFFFFLFCVWFFFFVKVLYDLFSISFDVGFTKLFNVNVMIYFMILLLVFWWILFYVNDFTEKICYFFVRLFFSNWRCLHRREIIFE